MSKQFWTLNSKGEEVLRDLEKEHENFSIEKYNSGEFDGNNFIWYEMFDMYLMESNGCDYERKGCYIKEGDVVVDIGANIGIFAHRAEVRGASKVLCFEPITKTYNCLQKNLGPKSESFKLSVSNKNEFKEFAIHTDYTHIGGAFLMNHQEHFTDKNIIHKESVFSININDIFNTVLTERIDFLKIDVEGSEVDILNSITDENLKKLRCLSVELHKTDESFEEFQWSFLERVHSLGFERFVLYHGVDTNAKLRTLTCWKS